VIEKNPESVHQLAAGLWRAAREQGWTRSARLSLRWRAPSGELADRLGRHLGNRFDRLPILDAGADAGTHDVGAAIALTAPTLSNIEAQIRWALEAGCEFQAALLDVGIGAPREAQ
jgi:hypothetical protein